MMQREVLSLAWWLRRAVRRRLSMANPEHVEIVKRGKEAIDTWWEENPKGKLDLEGANLTDGELGALTSGAPSSGTPTSVVPTSRVSNSGSPSSCAPAASPFRGGEHGLATLADDALADLPDVLAGVTGSHQEMLGRGRALD